VFLRLTLPIEEGELHTCPPKVEGSGELCKDEGIYNYPLQYRAQGMEHMVGRRRPYAPYKPKNEEKSVPYRLVLAGRRFIEKDEAEAETPELG